MERGLHFGSVSITLVLLLLLLKALIGFGTSEAQGSATGLEPRSDSRGSAATSGEHGPTAAVEDVCMENTGSAVTGADVTVEDDENWSAGEAEESRGESDGNVRLTR